MATNPKISALIIIDMQKGGFKPSEPKYNQEKVISNINLLIETFRKSELPVIFIQHDGTKEYAYIPGTIEWEIIDELNQSPTDHIISKTANSSFYKSDLDKTLKKLGCQSVFISGWATDFCVDATVKSAITHDYEVNIVSDGHTCSDRPNVAAKDVIEYFNWVWQNYTPTESGPITILSTEEIRSKIQI
jgi:nicotinamidase-related amidase